MKKTLTVFTIVGLVTLGGISFASTARASGSALIWFSPQTYTVQTDSTVDVYLLVNPNGESIDTVRANLTFPADILEVVSFTLGSQFPYPTPGNSWDNTAGTISEGAYVYGSPVLTEGTFGTITFRALSAGTATVSVADTSKLIYEGSEKINLTSLGSATVTVTGETVVSTQPTTTTSASLEQQALVYFGAFAARMPSNGVDWEALHCIAYDTCNPTTKVLSREQQALVAFGEKYARMPSGQLDWNTLHALAYTNVFYNWEEIEGTTTTTETEEETVAAEETTEEAAEETTETTESETVTEEATTTLTVQQQALGYFGTFTGRMPSSGEDWEAVDCITANTCYPGASGQDATKEGLALSAFTEKYDRLPVSDMDWNAIHALAYTNMYFTWE